MIIRFASVAVGYYLVARFGLAFAFDNASITAVWIPTGLAVAAVYFWGYRMAGAVLIAATLANLATPATDWTTPVIGLGNAAEAVVGAWILKGLSFDPALERAKDGAALVASALIAPLISASVGIAALSGASGGVLRREDWLLWWGGDATGLLVFGCAIFVLVRNPRRLEPWPAVAVIGATIGASLLALVSLAAVTLLAGVLVAIGLLRGPKAVCLAVLLAVTIFVALTVQGVGVFGDAAPDKALLSVQAGAALMVLIALISGAYARSDSARAISIGSR